MAKRFYDSNLWKRIRRAKLAANPLCELCFAKGIIEVAQEVDHIKPIEEGGSATDMDNLMSLSKSCHSKKTRRENAPQKRIITALEYDDTIVTKGKSKPKHPYRHYVFPPKK